MFLICDQLLLSKSFKLLVKMVQSLCKLQYNNNNINIINNNLTKNNNKNNYYTNNNNIIKLKVNKTKIN